MWKQENLILHTTKLVDHLYDLMQKGCNYVR